MISVIINVYNGEKFVGKCLDCVLNQTYKDLEILVINDGSTDKTLDIIKKYKDKRIRVITTENKGLSLSRNVGIDNAKGEYLYFIDVDDYIVEDTIEYLYNLLIKYDADIVTCKNKIVTNFNEDIINDKEIIKILDSEEMMKKILLPTNCEVTTWNKLVKRCLFDNLRFEDRIINDMAFTHKLVYRANKIVYSNQIKYLYLKHSGSITNKKASLARLIDIYNVFYERYLFVLDKYPNMIENNTCMCQKIVELYLKNNKELEKYLIKEDTINRYKKIFKIGIIRTNIGFREKIKLIIFRISPRFNKLIINIYLKIKGVK